METLQRIISEETQNYVATLQVGDDDYLRIEEELMKKIKIRITQANQIMGKGDSRLQMPKYLEFSEIAEILKATMIIKVLVDGDNEETQLLGIYDGEIYNTDKNPINKAAIALNHKLSKHDMDELINRLLLICDRVQINKDQDLIAVGNGIFDYKRKVLLPFSEDYVFLSKSIVNFNPNAALKTFPDNWNVENWLEDIAIDKEVCQLLWESIGAILRPYVKWDKSIWLYSTTGNNGKGTYCELLRAMLGPNAHTSIPIADFAKDFALTPLIGKQAIIVDENDVGIFIDRIGVMKAIITGDIVTIDRKFKDPINYRFRGMMVQCLNEYPKIKDKSDSFYRRQIFIPFEKCFTGHENKNIKSKYLHDPDVLEYVMYKVLMTDYYKLSEPAACKTALDNYKEINDPIRQYWSEFETEFAWDLVPYQFLFDLYNEWYKINFPRSQPASKPTFITNLKIIIKRESKLWTCDDDTNKRYRPGNKMSKPEMLIAAYNLTKWFSETYNGRDTKRRCTLLDSDLKGNYAGILRIRPEAEELKKQAELIKQKGESDNADKSDKHDIS